MPATNIFFCFFTGISIQQTFGQDNFTDRSPGFAEFLPLLI
ncbi:hypothetical protein HMPREF0765_4038 [Sphingobacterium spiritivorum ATCC 33300]|uniref:Uncharacterized protein n=1 Tax=Sphingobacterium spiritivorum ATCC 33300 TaxID=525372 RepID=C2G382_SPHSI|nr:hypothetical protein HMPREF0765_4038 [Sphingobacterium spiritivorum ATCC 33300]